MRRSRKVKILATIGPASSSVDMIRKLFEAGADVFRINMSHADHALMRALVERIRSVETELGRPIGILADLQGPKLRVGAFAEGKVTLEPGRRFPFPAAHEERAVYILSGELAIAGDRFAADQLLVFRPGDEITLEAGPQGCHVMLFGGAALNSRRYIWWNFVSSSRDRIEKAKEEWRTGRFDIVPGNEEEFVPLPNM